MGDTPGKAIAKQPDRECLPIASDCLAKKLYHGVNFPTFAPISSIISIIGGGFVNLDKELRDLKRSYDDIRWEIKSIIEKGNSQIKDLERFYSSNVGKVEETITQTLEAIEKEVNNLISNFEKQMGEYKTSQNKMLKEMEEAYLKEIEAKKKNLETEFKSKIKCQFVVKGVL